MEDLEVQIKNSFSKKQMEMLKHLRDYGVKVEPYVKEKFPTGFESYELFEVLAEYFTHTANLLKQKYLEEEC
ncbi:hypothetical protein O3777_03405 [Gemella sanguinis]|uniref:hypothetical protein n=1 Tax=Gemella sanguinis TaxID=84135 RepID=UPI00352BF773